MKKKHKDMFTCKQTFFIIELILMRRMGLVGTEGATNIDMQVCEC